ncbi:hypothetical protein QQ045_024793 [Rhodiola kirilowii]
MDCRSLTAYNNASLAYFNGGLPSKFIKSKTRKASIVTKNALSATHLQPNPNRSLQQQEKPVRRHQISKTIRPRKKKSDKVASTNVPDVLRLMDALRLQIGADVYSELVEECTAAKDSIGAQALLEHIRKSRIRAPVSLLNRLLLMNVECGLFEITRQLFDEMPVRNLSSYAIMIAARFDKGEFEESLDMFLGMIKQNFFIDEADFPLWIVDCVLKACLHSMNLELGKQVHSLLIKQGQASDPCLGSSLINLYGKCRLLDEAASVFHHLPCRDTVAWTAQIVNKCKEGNFDDSINLFTDMCQEGVKMNHFTYSSVLRACGSASTSAWCGKQVHARVIKSGCMSNSHIQCGMIDMYAKRGLLSEARRVFDTMHDETNMACWNSMIVGYLHQQQLVEAMILLYKMKDTGLQPQESLFSEVKIACGSNKLEPH